MEKIIKLITLTLFFSISINMYSQLTGVYSIGGSSADYLNLTSAVSDIYNNGMTGSVTFNLNPGTHTSVTFTDSIPGITDSTNLTIQSASLDPDIVNFNNTFVFDNAANIVIRAVTINAMNRSAVNFIESVGIKIVNCIINSSVSTGNNNYPIYIEHQNYGYPLTDIILDSCNISSNIVCVHYEGTRGFTTINNSVLNTSDDFAIETGSQFWWLYLNNNELEKSIDAEYKSVKGSFKNNNINGKSAIRFVDTLIGNNFYSDEIILLGSKYIKNNYFEATKVYFKDRTKSFYIDNIFNCILDIETISKSEIRGNTFKKSSLFDIKYDFFNFSNNIINRNIEFRGLYYDNHSHVNIRNNVFSNSIVKNGVRGVKISYNNFLNGSYIDLWMGVCSITNNNFCCAIRYNGDPQGITNNNYYPFAYTPLDSLATYYDPMYHSENLGIATNPLLQGKGNSDFPETDFLYRQRKFPPAIGSNEVMICNDSTNNQIDISCGDELFLNICNLSDSLNYFWTPDSLFTNPDTSYTSIKPYGDLSIYLHESDSTIIDSFYIKTVPFQVRIASLPELQCGIAKRITSNQHSNATYSWTPENGLSNPNISNPWITLYDTNNLVYKLESTIEQCGASSDSIIIDFNPKPNIYRINETQIFDTLYFSSESNCVNDYLWEFYDGSTSTDEIPYFIHTENGSYKIKLTVSNDFGTAIDSSYYYFYTVRTDQIDNQKEISIYPNPATDKIIITNLPDVVKELSIITIEGIEVYSKKHISTNIEISIADFKTGIYIINICSKESVFKRKVIIQ